MKNEKSVYFIGGGVTLDFRIVEDNLFILFFLDLKQKNKSTPKVYISNILIKILKCSVFFIFCYHSLYRQKYTKFYICQQKNE